MLVGVVVPVRRAGVVGCFTVAVAGGVRGPGLRVVVAVVRGVVAVSRGLGVVRSGELGIAVGLELAGPQLGGTVVVVAELVVQRDVETGPQLDPQQPDHRGERDEARASQQRDDAGSRAGLGAVTHGAQ